MAVPLLSHVVMTRMTTTTSLCQGPIKQRARAEKCLYKGTTCTPWHIKVLLSFGGWAVAKQWQCIGGGGGGARWWLSVYYGQHTASNCQYCHTAITCQHGHKWANGWRCRGSERQAALRVVVVRQLLENQNTKGHWCPVDG